MAASRVSAGGKSCRRRCVAGLTLVELLITLAILTMVATITGATYREGLERVRFNGASRDIVNALRSSRQRALSSQREAVFELDVEAQHYAAAGRRGVLNAPSSTIIVLVTAETERHDVTTGNIRFFPDGSSTGGRITLTRGGRTTVITVDWLTGRIEVGS